MSFVGTHKWLFFRLIVGFLFVAIVVAVFMYRNREKFPWLFPPPESEQQVLPAENGDAGGGKSPQFEV